MDKWIIWKLFSSVGCKVDCLMLFASMQMENYGSAHVFVFVALVLLVNHNAFATVTAGK